MNNATNNNTFFKEFEYICIKNSIKFDYNQSYVQCLAYTVSSENNSNGNVTYCFDYKISIF